MVHLTLQGVRDEGSRQALFAEVVLSLKTDEESWAAAQQAEELFFEMLSSE